MRRRLFPLVAAVLAAFGAPTVALAQMDSEVEAALNSGAVGEQADGYLGFPRAPAPSLRAKVEAVNIKRRQGYTQVAQSRNVPIEAFAASIGCRRLSGLQQGRTYSIGGAWAVKGSAPINLPPQCGE